MNNPSSQGDFRGSFLPEDYIVHRAERRHSLLALAMFCVVMLGVIAAFFVTNRQWTTVKTRQDQINREYAAEAAKIDQLKVLEDQKSEMFEKAEITTALIEKVPRSILFAELINRMPEELSLTQLTLKSKRIVDAPAAPPKSSGGSSASRRRSQTKSLASGKDKPAPPEPGKPRPPRYEYTMELVGLAGNDSQVADYHRSLNTCPLLERVDLVSAGEIKVDDVVLRQFRIEASIRPTADARTIEPLEVPRARSIAGARNLLRNVPEGITRAFGLTSGRAKAEEPAAAERRRRPDEFEPGDDGWDPDLASEPELGGVSPEEE